MASGLQESWRAMGSCTSTRLLWARCEPGELQRMVYTGCRPFTNTDSDVCFICSSIFSISDTYRYNYPGVTNNIMITPETYTALAQHPNIVGCKMSHGN